MTLQDHLVTVMLSNCTDDDAHRVLSHLGVLAGAPGPTPAPAGGGSHAPAHPTVWTAEVDPEAGPPEAGSDARAAGLDGSVALNAQGSPHGVQALRDVLAQAFTVEDTGSVSGDQERDCQFRLTAR
ncbi:hypothetical protein [Streptomyces xanthii]|uniref:Uncharacterized protein n=1 Tax=Streptomyces xanthii TaxID=2768069 RepID=A0A7H1B1Y6_9ACTN|nr:hypothetical protein [Streptomyces xanthii]QNS02741.1 hypothetical protein IAG42_03285 [Streptomyces xanthii]